MNLFDLFKATLACGGIAFIIYSYPVLSQAVIIGLLALLWSTYAYKTFVRLARR